MEINLKVFRPWRFLFLLFVGATWTLERSNASKWLTEMLIYFDWSVPALHNITMKGRIQAIRKKLKDKSHLSSDITFFFTHSLVSVLSTLVLSSFPFPPYSSVFHLLPLFPLSSTFPSSFLFLFVCFSPSIFFHLSSLFLLTALTGEGCALQTGV